MKERAVTLKSSNGRTKISVLWAVVPAFFYGGCHGDDEKQVFEELCQMVDEMIALFHQDRRPASAYVRA